MCNIGRVIREVERRIYKKNMRVLNAVEEKKVKISFRHFVYQFSHGSPFVLDD